MNSCIESCEAFSIRITINFVQGRGHGPSCKHFPHV